MSIVFSKRSDVVAASAARTTTGSSGAFSIGHQDFLSVMLDVTAVSGTSPSMTVTVEWSNNNTTWYAADPADTFTAITANTSKVKQFAVKGTLARLTWTITGTTPSFTFSAVAVIGI